MTAQHAYSRLVQALSDTQALLNSAPQNILKYPIDIRYWKRESGEGCECDFDAALDLTLDAVSAHEKIASERITLEIQHHIGILRARLTDFATSLHAHPLARRNNSAVGTTLEISKKETTQIYVGWTLYQDPNKAGGALYSEPFELAQRLHPKRLAVLDAIAQTFSPQDPFWIVTGKKPFEPDVLDHTITHLNVLYRTRAPNAETALRIYAANQATWLFKKDADFKDLAVLMASPLQKDFSL